MPDTNRHSILILEGASAYDSMRGFNQEIARAVRGAGCRHARSERYGAF